VDVEKLFADHYEGLFKYLVRLTGDPDLAADVAQESFVRLVEKNPANSGIRAWLYRVATNVVRDEARVRRRRIELLLGSPDRLPQGDPPLVPDRYLELMEKQAGVRRALDSLSSRDQTVLLMREEGFSHREIAEAVGTTTKSVGSMIARALRKLANELALKPETTE